MPRILTIIFIALLLPACAQTPVAKVKETLTLKAQAEVHYARRECSQAIPLYEQLSREMPNFAEAWLKIGNCHVYLNDLDTAVLSYRKAIQQDPSYVKAWHNLTQVQARILGNTVTEMYRNVDATDPMAVEVRRFALSVLEAFDIPASTGRPAANGQDDKAGDDDNLALPAAEPAETAPMTVQQAR